VNVCISSKKTGLDVAICNPMVSFCKRPTLISQEVSHLMGIEFRDNKSERFLSRLHGEVRIADTSEINFATKCQVFY
jgi:hypothetical protein